MNCIARSGQSVLLNGSTARCISRSMYLFSGNSTILLPSTRLEMNWRFPLLENNFTTYVTIYSRILASSCECTTSAGKAERRRKNFVRVILHDSVQKRHLIKREKKSFQFCWWSIPVRRAWLLKNVHNCDLIRDYSKVLFFQASKKIFS